MVLAAQGSVPSGMPSVSEPPEPARTSGTPRAIAGGPLAIDVIASAELLDAGSIGSLRDLILRAAAAMSLSGEVRVRIVGDEQMADAHERWGGVPGTTDVLTFDMRDGRAAFDREMDMDVLVCVDEARRQAAARGIALGHEMLLYVVHAMLHCLGYDDHDDEGYRAMHEREDEILRGLGVGPVFARESREGAADAGGGAS